MMKNYSFFLIVIMVVTSCNNSLNFETSNTSFSADSAIATNTDSMIMARREAAAKAYLSDLKQQELDQKKADSTLKDIEKEVGGIALLWSAESKAKCNLYQECYHIKGKRQSLHADDLKALASALAHKLFNATKSNEDCRTPKMVQVYLFLSPTQMQPDPKGIAMGDYVALCNINPGEPEGSCNVHDYILAHGKY